MESWFSVAHWQAQCKLFFYYSKPIRIHIERLFYRQEIFTQEANMALINTK